MNDHVRPCNLKPPQRDLTPVLRRPVEPAPESGRSSEPIRFRLSANTGHSRMQSGLTGFGRKRTGRFGAADPGKRTSRCAARMNARGNSQSRALAIHPPVRTALTPAVSSDFAKVLSKLPPEELERCSELLYN